MSRVRSTRADSHNPGRRRRPSSWTTQSQRSRAEAAGCRENSWPVEQRSRPPKGMRADYEASARKGWRDVNGKNFWSGLGAALEATNWCSLHRSDYRLWIRTALGQGSHVMEGLLLTRRWREKPYTLFPIKRTPTLRESPLPPPGRRLLKDFTPNSL